ncbi:MAG TPA: hypothetical protein ENI12_04270 [Nitrospirae bacterium]|nr:hypothetical protein [Nitrospirota bacterium]
MRKRILVAIVLTMVVALFTTTAFAARRGNVEQVTKEQLLKMMDENDPGLIIVDVRKGTDWRASEFMIKGAVRLKLSKINSVKYPKDKKLVLY